LVRSLPKGNSTQIFGGSKGTFWFIIDQYVYRLDPATERVRSYPMDGRLPVATSIAMTPDSSLWVSTSKGCIRRYLPLQDSFYTYSVYRRPIRFRHRSKSYVRWMTVLS
jgi:streptogramin lyase